MPRVICPFCTRPHELSDRKCPHTDYLVPQKYIKNYVGIPPLWLMTIGFSEVGKSTFLSMLTLTLERCADILDGMWYQPLDSFTFQQIQTIHDRVANHQSPPPTKKDDPPRPMLFHVNGMPGNPPRCLVLYDIAGEVFESFEAVENLSPALRQVNTAWFMVSLSDLENSSTHQRLSDLFMVYLKALEKYNVDVTGLNLIVVYTKADSHSFSAEINDYLLSDPLLGLDKSRDSADRQDFNARLVSGEYLEEMGRASELLFRYTCEKTDGGRNFVSMAEANEMKLAFCVISALGSSPDPNGQYTEKPRPHRVLDPLLWALHLETPPVEISVGLVADISEGSKDTLSPSLLLEVWNTLSNETTVTTYNMGRGRPVSEAGQTPPITPPLLRKPRLIGPLLENAPPDQRFVVLSTGPILDLTEFTTDSWRHRLLIVKIGREYESTWPNQQIFRSGDDPQPIVESVLQMN